MSHSKFGYSLQKLFKKDEIIFGPRMYVCVCVCMYVCDRSCPPRHFRTRRWILLNFGYVIHTGEISRRGENQILESDSILAELPRFAYFDAMPRLLNWLCRSQNQTYGSQYSSFTSDIYIIFKHCLIKFLYAY